MTKRTPEQLTDVALGVATSAAELVLSGFRQSFSVAKKAFDELYTEYDVKSEELMRRHLEELTPEIPVVGEEHGGEGSDELTWYLDPIDGTINFAAGNPWFAVSVGAMRGDKPVCGAVVAPALNVFWSGWVGGEARRNGELCRISNTQALSEALVTTGFPRRRAVASDRSERPSFGQEFLKMADRVRDVRRGGSAAIELCLVAEGTYDLYWMRSLPRWDTAAGAAIVLAAGGRWDTFQSGTVRAQNVAANGRLASEFSKLMDL